MGVGHGGLQALVAQEVPGCDRIRAEHRQLVRREVVPTAQIRRHMLNARSLKRTEPEWVWTEHELDAGGIAYRSVPADQRWENQK